MITQTLPVFSAEYLNIHFKIYLSKCKTNFLNLKNMCEGLCKMIRNRKTWSIK